MARNILRAEGLAIFLGSLYIYNAVGLSWLFFLVSFLAPDVSMVGFAVDKRVGVIAYNLAHNYASAFVAIFLGLVGGNIYIVSFGIVMVAHTGLDRFLGFGLKYESGRESHIQKV